LGLEALYRYQLYDKTFPCRHTDREEELASSLKKLKRLRRGIVRVAGKKRKLVAARVGRVYHRYVANHLDERGHQGMRSLRRNYRSEGCRQRHDANHHQQPLCKVHVLLLQDV
jgi:hypothetical protein